MAMKQSMIYALIGAFAFALVGCDDDNDNDESTTQAEVRIVHASPDAPDVDVLVNDSVELMGVPYKGVSGYLPVDAENDPNFKINAASTTTTVIDATPDLLPESRYTLLAVGELANIEPLLLTDDTPAPATGFLKVRVLHASPTAAPVDIYVTSPTEDISTVAPTLTSVAFKSSSDYLEIAAGDYRLRITLTNSKTPIYDSGTLPLEAGLTATIAAVTAQSGISPISLLLLTGDDNNPSVEVADARARVRAVHASPDAPNVDILIDDAVVLTDLPFTGASGYLEVVGGERNFKINATGTASTVIDETTDLDRGQDYTLLAVNFLTSIEPLLTVDDNSAPTPGNARLRVIHASPDAPNVDVLVDDMVVLTNVPFKAISDYLDVSAGARNIKVNATGTSTTVIDVTPTLVDGKVYTVIALNQLSAIEPLLLIDN
jgi:hypothetical protein